MDEHVYSLVIERITDVETLCDTSLVSKEFKMLTHEKRQSMYIEKEQKAIEDVKNKFVSCFTSSDLNTRQRNFMLFVCKLARYKWFLCNSSLFCESFSRLFGEFVNDENIDFLKSRDVDLIMMIVDFSRIFDFHKSQQNFIVNIVKTLVNSREVKNLLGVVDF
jgi:hypothetical protein